VDGLYHDLETALCVPSSLQGVEVSAVVWGLSDVGVESMKETLRDRGFKLQSVCTKLAIGNVCRVVSTLCIMWSPHVDYTPRELASYSAVPLPLAEVALPSSPE